MALFSAMLLSIVTACSERRQGPAASWELAAQIHSDSSAAEALYWRGEYDSARVLWRNALVRARSSNDSSTESRLLTWQGLAAWRLGDYPEARRSGEAALALKLRLGLTRELFKSYNALGLLAWNEGRLLDAVERLNAAAASAAAAGDNEGVAKAAGNLALVQTELGEFASARTGFSAMLEASRALGDRRLEGNGLTNLAMLDIRVGDPASAIRRLHQARALYQSLGYAAGEMSALGQLGVAYQATGELQLALASLDSALGLSRKHQLRQEEASNLEALAQVHQGAGDWRRALRLYAEAQTVNGELGLRVEQGTDLRLEAEIHRDLAETAVARRKATGALELHRDTEAHVEELHDRILLAELAQATGELRAAREHLDLGHRIAARSGARTSRAEVALARARMSQHLGNHRAALRIIAQARADLEAGDYGIESEAEALRAHAFRALGQLDSAMASGYVAVRAVERVRENLASGALRTSYLTSKAAVYSELVDVLVEQGTLEQAFEVADAARGRALLEHLAAAPAHPGPGSAVQTLTAGDELLRRTDALAAELAEIDNRPVPERDSTHEAMRQYLTAQIQETRSAFEALLAHAAARDAPAVQLLGARRASLRNIQAVLQPNEALLQYLVGPEQVHLFLVTSSGIRRHPVAATSEELVARIRLARELVARPGSVAGPPPPVLSALHELLIRPVLGASQLAGVDRLLIVPHSALAYLPFGALYDRERGRYLAEDFALISLPSAAALPSLRSGAAEIRAEDQSRSVVLAPYPEALPATRTESAAFVRSVAGAKAEIGRAATEGRLRWALQGTGFVHLASHGRMNPVNPMFSRLEIASGRSGRLDDDGRLEVHELLGLTIRSPLVFLSGCETGVGAAWSNRYQPGEDYATLAQAFLYAGAGSVVSTLWRIQDDGAAAFAERFYGHLEREAPPEALALTQRDMLRDGRYGAPYYWAAYQVAGRGELRAVAQK